MKWQEMVSKSTPSHADWRIAMHLRVNQVEEKREVLTSELPELEEEVRDLQRPGQVQGWTKQTTAGQKLMEKEELETLQQSTQHELREQDPSCKNELAELRFGSTWTGISVAFLLCHTIKWDYPLMLWPANNV